MENKMEKVIKSVRNNHAVYDKVKKIIYVPDIDEERNLFLGMFEMDLNKVKDIPSELKTLTSVLGWMFCSTRSIFSTFKYRRIDERVVERYISMQFAGCINDLVIEGEEKDEDLTWRKTHLQNA